VPNFVKVGQTVADIWQFNGFQNGSHPSPWIFEIRIFNGDESCCVHVWTTHDEHLVVLSAVQNLVGIDAVVLIICMFQYFAH